MMAARVLVFASVLLPLCTAFSPALPLATRAAASRTSVACSARMSEDQRVARRSVISTGLALAGAALLPTAAFAADTVVLADEDKVTTGKYQDDVKALLASMKTATSMKKGDPTMKPAVEKARKQMNEFVSFYRRNTKIAGAASFSTLYTAISTLSGHFQNYGPEYPVPAKRAKRLNQQYAEVEKQIERGR